MSLHAPLPRSSPVWGGIFFMVLVALSATASAHPLAPALLELQESRRGIELLWKTSTLQPSNVVLEPIVGGPCRVGEPLELRATGDSITRRWRVVCEPSSPAGATLGVRGLSASGTNALVRVAFADGRVVRAVLSADEPSLVVPAREAWSRVAADYLKLGATHLLGGADHLLFLLGLLKLVSGTRRLLAAATAFTVGHSVTLSLAAIGGLSLPPPLVELAIAATLLRLGVELAGPRATHGTLMQRHLWPVTFAFGLIHGLGFAGALTLAGLPADEVPLALLSFNAGLELAQVAVIGLALVARLAVGRVGGRLPASMRQAPAYVVGTLAVYWCLERSLGLFHP